MPEAWQTEKHKAEERIKIIHDAVRMMKMGDRGVIAVGKHTEDEMRQSLWAYALFKGKWFDSEYDKTAKIFRIQRSTPLPDREIEEPFGGEEEA